MAAWGWLVLIEEPHHRLILVGTHPHRTVMLDQSILELLLRSSSCETWVHIAYRVSAEEGKKSMGHELKHGYLLTRLLLFHIAM